MTSTSDCEQTSLSFAPKAQKATRKSYVREAKLSVIAFYKENRINLYKTCQHFDLNTKNVLRWLKNEKEILESKRGSR